MRVHFVCPQKVTMSIKKHQFRSLRILAPVSFWSPAPVYLIPLHLTHFSFLWSVARPHQTCQRDCDRFRPEFTANILLPTMVEKPVLMVTVLRKKKLNGILPCQHLSYKGNKAESILLAVMAGVGGIYIKYTGNQTLL